MTKITYVPEISNSGTKWEITIDGDNIDFNDIKILSESVMESHSKERIAYWDNEKIKTEEYKYKYKYKIIKNISVFFFIAILLFCSLIFLNKNNISEEIKNLQNQLTTIQNNCTNNYRNLESLLVAKNNNRKP